LPGLRGEVAWLGVGLPSLKARDEERAASARVFAGDVAAILACRSRRGAFIRRLLFSGCEGRSRKREARRVENHRRFGLVPRQSVCLALSGGVQIPTTDATYPRCCRESPQRLVPTSRKSVRPPFRRAAASIRPVQTAEMVYWPGLGRRSAQQRRDRTSLCAGCRRIRSTFALRILLWLAGGRHRGLGAFRH
jgi:hypothetical protein